MHTNLDTTTNEQAYALLDTPTAELMGAAAELRDLGHGSLVSYSPKVFIPLTKLCRDVCHYCTFAQPPRKGERAYLTADEVLAIARTGQQAGCREALFTLGDKPELRYQAARDELAALDVRSTIDYLEAMCRLVLKETELLPHANPGVMTREEIERLRTVSVSQGLMLESTSERLCERGGPHHGSPDKRPDVRLQTIGFAGELQVPFTSGILIGIGETRRERVDSLLALRALNSRYGHIQEIIIQNFRAKPGTKMATGAEPTIDDLQWTVAVARLIFGAQMNIQAPPNLSPDEYPQLLASGINDWGGVSPVTQDHVNPEAPWPELEQLRGRTEAAGKTLVPRLAIYPTYIEAAQRWLDPGVRSAVLHAVDTAGFAREDGWTVGQPNPKRYAPHVAATLRASAAVTDIITKAQQGEGTSEDDLVRLFAARNADYEAVCRAGDQLRQDINGDAVTYVVNRNINYTNVCYYRCQFCAFSKGKLSENLRGKPYDLALEEITRRAEEAWQRGATEVCLQGGIHPDYTGNTYLRIARAIKAVVPEMHIHAFSPLEVWQGAATLGLSVAVFLEQLRDAGLGTLPGTAAEILDDEVRARLCPDKVSTDEWLSVMANAHELGLRTTSTIMFGHIESYRSWARHLLRLRALQERTGGFTEFVPLPFVHMEAPIYLKGLARRGPTLREAVLMHAVARLALHPHITSIQTSWTKMGTRGAELCLNAGANDLGGTLMNESISRAAGSQHGQELPPQDMEALIRSLGRPPVQRTTLYARAPEERRRASLQADALTPMVQTPAAKYARVS